MASPMKVAKKENETRPNVLLQTILGFCCMRTVRAGEDDVTVFPRDVFLHGGSREKSLVTMRTGVRQHTVMLVQVGLEARQQS